MSQASSKVVPYEQRLRENTGDAMAEAGNFFEGNSAVHRALRRVTARLDELGIPYAVVGGMAVSAHGYVRTTDDVDMLVTGEGLTRIHEALEGLGWVPPFAGSKHLRDTTHGVKIEFLVTGEYPGDGKDKPIRFPDPRDVAVVKDGIRYLDLPTLIELKLASGMSRATRRQDLADVQKLIEAVGLDRGFAERLHEYVRPSFVQLWQELEDERASDGR